MRTHCDSISARQSLGKRRCLTKVRQTKNRMQNTFRSWHVFLIMGLMVLFIIAAMVYSFRIGKHMTTKYASQIDATMMIRYKAAMARLWFEEIIAGDRYSNIEKVWKDLNESEWYIRALLEGGTNWEGVFIKLEDSHLREEIQIVQAKLAGFRSIAKERFAAIEDSPIGSEIDQRFDRVFEDFIEQAEHVEIELRKFMNKDILHFRSTQIALLISVAGLSLLSLLILCLFNNQRARHLQLIQQSREHIQQQNEFLNDVLESLPHPFYVIDTNDYTIKLANSAARKDELSEDATCYMLNHNRDKPCEGADEPCPLEEIKATKKPMVVEHTHYDQEGNPKHVEVHGYPIFDDNQNVSQIIEYCLDITARKQAEKKLKKKMDELGRFNKLAVGRELQMVELKKEVDALLRELDRQEKYRDEVEFIENRAAAMKAKICRECSK